MAEANHIIEVEGLKKSFNDNEVLAGIDIALQKGENLVVLGKSGVGKSVLIKCIVRLVEADEGKILVFGEDINAIEKEHELNAIRRKIGFLFQGGALYDAMTVEENLRFPVERTPEKIDSAEIEEKIDEVLENVGLENTRKKMPAELSGGMKKRIALARTLILKPDIMLYDEPTTGLDPVTSQEISELLVEMQEKYGMSSIIITHDINCARLTANRMAIIKDGVFGAEGTFDELSKSDKDWIKPFFN